SDTETILHLYEEKGERCVEDLRGMFAFAIWNEKQQELLLARDRVGKKPLFYATTGRAILFASELKSLLAEPNIGRELSLEALHDYLTFQYIPAPDTIFEQINKLPPAHTLLWRQGNLHIRRYWQLEYEPKLNISEEEACERIRAEIDEAVRIRLESEVPLGCLLSGGIDSSAVVAFMRRHISGPLRTFSIGFEEKTHNELPFARVVAEKFETVHEEFIVRPNAIEVLPKLVWHFDEPYCDSSALPSYYVAEITRRHVTVALNGDGGDESFAGYSRYEGRSIVNRYLRIPTALRRWAVGPTARLLGALFPESTKVEKLNYLNEFSLLSPDRLYAQYMIIFRDYQKPLLYAPQLQWLVQSRDSIQTLLDAYNRESVKTEIDRKLYCDITTYLPGDLLVKMDRMTMAHSLEGRSPFLDHKLMEFAARIPAELKFKGGTLKYILKKALEPILPHEEVLYRPKQGFGVPLTDWFQKDLQGFLREVLLSDEARKRGFFRPRFVRKLIDDHVSGQQNHHHRLWSLLCFEIWCRSFLDRPDPTAGPIRL
ncbi:MAG: asparagine synthase (glutamine-hydrolyzing), partial [bacterium]